MDATLTYALLAGVVIVIVAVIARTALRWALKVFAFLLVLAVLAGGTWLWFSYSKQQPPWARTPASSKRVNPDQH